MVDSPLPYIENFRTPSRTCNVPRLSRPAKFEVIRVRARELLTAEKIQLDIVEGITLQYQAAVAEEYWRRCTLKSLGNVKVLPQIIHGQQGVTAKHPLQEEFATVGLVGRSSNIIHGGGKAKKPLAKKGDGSFSLREHLPQVSPQG